MDNILPTKLLPPADIATGVARRVRDRRLAAGLTRDELAARAGMSAASLKRFERTGKIAFDALVRLAVALDAVAGFDRLFEGSTYASIDDVLLQQPGRRRGRRRPRPA